jgi:hypothetical protein
MSNFKKKANHIYDKFLKDTVEQKGVSEVEICMITKGAFPVIIHFIGGEKVKVNVKGDKRIAFSLADKIMTKG